MSALQSTWDRFPNVTELIRRSQHGDREAEAELLSFAYPYLQSVAAQMVSRFRSDGVESGEVLHEAWLGLRNMPGTTHDRSHYIAVLRKAIRHRMISHHRKQTAVKRDQQTCGRTFPEYRVDELPKEYVVELYRQLGRLAEAMPLEANVVSLLYEFGFSLEETANILGVSVKVVRGRWNRASQWLKQKLSGR